MSFISSPFDFNHLPQRGLVKDTTAASRTWLVSLAEAKEHLRVGHTDDDTYITRLTQAAQLVCESLCGTDFTPMTYYLTCDTWEQTIEIPEVSPVRSIDHIKYYDTATPSVQQTWSAADYYLDNGSQRSRITLVDGAGYPQLRSGTGSIEVKFITKASWNLVSTTALSAVAVQAILITIADMYENRQSVIVGRIASSIPKTAEYLLNTMKIQTL